jgi:hypothetical protein
MHAIKANEVKVQLRSLTSAFNGGEQSSPHPIHLTVREIVPDTQQEAEWAPEPGWTLSRRKISLVPA